MCNWLSASVVDGVLFQDILFQQVRNKRCYLRNTGPPTTEGHLWLPDQSQKPQAHLSAMPLLERGILTWRTLRVLGTVESLGCCTCSTECVRSSLSLRNTSKDGPHIRRSAHKNNFATCLDNVQLRQCGTELSPCECYIVHSSDFINLTTIYYEFIKCHPSSDTYSLVCQNAYLLSDWRSIPSHRSLS